MILTLILWFLDFLALILVTPAVFIALKIIQVLI